MADVTHLNLADLLESFLSLLVLCFLKQFQFRRQLGFPVLLTDLNYHIAK